ncbi:phosphodiester glycosidase family protein [Lolliginicoccus suaedae]|uniref:phosphodiester glycosidase family protein n=1 Tax=Lolliginicoccus suaedae TaxID=2605429 RepID=UPI001CA8979B|nr:phosphodiester glycosidase family protein [Lolliginicoccus suaedae]
MSVSLAPVAGAQDGAGSNHARVLWNQAVDAAAGSVLAYQTGPDAPMPLQREDRTWYSSPRDARIVAVPNASRTITGRLLTEAPGESGRCESTPGAATSDGTAQSMELLEAGEAWEVLQRPAILINTNFFDVRPQVSGATWRESGCSVPFGVYFDNSAQLQGAGAAAGTEFYSGPKGLTGELEQGWGRLATFIISGDGTAASSIEMIVAPSPFDNAEAESRLADLHGAGRVVTAFSGLSLLHPSGAVDAPDGVRAARSAVAYSPALDRLFFVQAGSSMDRESGLTQSELRDLLRGLGATMGVQLDSGGSSAMLLNRGSGVHWAGQGVVGGVAPPGDCPALLDAVCSPGMGADGSSRAVAGWLGVGSPVIPQPQPQPEPPQAPEAGPEGESAPAPNDAELAGDVAPQGDPEHSDSPVSALPLPE